jgi:hypothetical protein
MTSNRHYLCQYRNCYVRLPGVETFIVGWPRKAGALRYCSAIHAALTLLRHTGAEPAVLQDLEATHGGIPRNPREGRKDTDG